MGYCCNKKRVIVPLTYDFANTGNEPGTSVGSFDYTKNGATEPGAATIVGFTDDDATIRPLQAFPNLPPPLRRLNIKNLVLTREGKQVTLSFGGSEFSGNDPLAVTASFPPVGLNTDFLSLFNGDPSYSGEWRQFQIILNNTEAEKFIDKGSANFQYYRINLGFDSHVGFAILNNKTDKQVLSFLVNPPDSVGVLKPVSSSLPVFIFPVSLNWNLAGN